MLVNPIHALEDLPATSLRSREAFAYCRALACRHDENFTVISWRAPRAVRAHLAALYAYCRTVDDLGDEAQGDRLQLLERWEAQLDAAYRGASRHPVMVALQETIRRYQLPRAPLMRLIEANRIDQRRCRYATFDELVDYCSCSANPVGQLVLALYSIRDPECIALSDATCTALQLTNFWQDVKRDYAMGRIYLPQEDMAAFDVCETDLAASTASDALVRLMRFQVERARGYFAHGLPLIDRVPGHLKLDLALFSRGGLAVLHKIERQGFDPLRRRPRLTPGEKAWLAASTVVSRSWTAWI